MPCCERDRPMFRRPRGYSPPRRRSPSPYRRASPPRRRSPSPIRRRSPSPIRRRSPSPPRRYGNPPASPAVARGKLHALPLNLSRPQGPALGGRNLAVTKHPRSKAAARKFSGALKHD